MDQILNIVNTVSGFLKGGNPIVTAIGAILFLIVGRIVVGIITGTLGKVLKKSGLNDKFKGADIAGFIVKIIKFLLMIIVLMIVLEMLGVTQVLDPLKNMVGEFFTYVPNILGAGIIAYVAFMLAGIVSELVESVADKIRDIAVKNLKLSEEIDVVTILKKVVYVVVLIPILIAALDVLKIEAISGPAKEMLETFIASVPKIILAAIVLAVSVFLGKFVSGLAKDLMNSFNVDGFAQMMGLSKMIGGLSITKLVGGLIFFYISYFGVMTAVEKLEFAQLSTVLSEMLPMISNILLGLLILAIGSFVANFAQKNFSKNNDNAFMGSIVKAAIMAVFLSMGLSKMNLADNIVELAFGLILGAVAVAVALSYGLGGREAAGEHFKQIVGKLNNKSVDNNNTADNDFNQQQPTQNNNLNNNQQV